MLAVAGIAAAALHNIDISGYGSRLALRLAGTTWIEFAPLASGALRFAVPPYGLVPSPGTSKDYGKTGAAPYFSRPGQGGYRGPGHNYRRRRASSRQRSNDHKHERSNYHRGFSAQPARTFGPETKTFAYRTPVPPQRWHFTTLSPFFSRPLPSQFLHFCFFLMLGPFWLVMTFSRLRCIE